MRGLTSDGHTKFDQQMIKNIKGYHSIGIVNNPYGERGFPLFGASWHWSRAIIIFLYPKGFKTLRERQGK